MNYKFTHFILLSIVWHLLCLTMVEIKPPSLTTEKDNLKIDFLGPILRQGDIAFFVGGAESRNIVKEKVKLKDFRQDWDFGAEKDKPEVFMSFKKKLPQESSKIAPSYPPAQSDKGEERIRLELNPDD